MSVETSIDFEQSQGGTHWTESAETFAECEKEPPCETEKKCNERILEFWGACRNFSHRHVVTDFAHQYRKLKVQWDELSGTMKPRSNGRGQATDVTAHLKYRPPRQRSTDPKNPTEWFGLKSCDVTRHRTAALRGRRPPSRDIHYGIQATDITEQTRKIAPAAPSASDDEPRKILGKPKTDVTNFDILPEIIPDETCRNDDLLHPLGKSRIPIPYRYHTAQYSADEDVSFSKISQL